MAKTSETLAQSSLRVSHSHKRLVRISDRTIDQRWYAFQTMGPAPSARSGHAMASMGSRVFVLGGLGGASLNSAESEDLSLVHVLDTSESGVSTSTG